MKKNSPIYDDEIDLIALFKIIWDGKIKILLITLISFLVGFVYNSQIPENYLNSLDIKPHENTEFIKLDYIQKLLNSNQSNQSNQLYLDRFINELSDYEEFLINVKDTKKVQEYLSTLNDKEQEIELFQFAKSLEINAPNKNEENYTINFKWHDPEEAQKILQDTLNLTSNNLGLDIHKEIESIFELEKKLVLKKDAERLNYLNDI